jgi:dynamin 1-like protein
MSTLGEDLLNIVNRLQDLVFNTIGNDSLDLPQIVSQEEEEKATSVEHVLHQIVQC